ncbi:MAG: hypothetical protein ACREHD_32670, partial [Pirellulales bacterium]
MAESKIKKGDARSIGRHPLKRLLRELAAGSTCKQNRLNEILGIVVLRPVVVLLGSASEEFDG